MPEPTGDLPHPIILGLEQRYLLTLGGAAIAPVGSTGLIGDIPPAWRTPDDREVGELVTTLLDSSSRFVDSWGKANVALNPSTKKTIETPAVGLITLDCDVLTAPGSDLRVVVYTAEAGTPDTARLGLLRVAGLQTVSTTTS
jgi:hypothetical protein